LPTAAEDILEALPVEKLTKELQKKRAERLARLNAGEGTATGSDMSSVAPSLLEDDRKSVSSESFLRTSQLGDPVLDEDASQPKRNKTQLWNEVKITCTFFTPLCCGTSDGDDGILASETQWQSMDTLRY
jgi:peroxin-3